MTMYRLEATNISGAIKVFKARLAKDVIAKFDEQYNRKGFRLALYKLVDCKFDDPADNYQDVVFIRFIKAGYR